MSVAPIRTPLPLADRLSALVESWSQRCLDTGKPPSEVLTEADMAGLDADVAVHLLRAGAVAATNGRLGGLRPAPGDAAGPRRNPIHAAQGRNPTVWRGLGIALVAADGVLKPLLAFSLSDAEHLASHAGTMQAAWSRRQGWAKKAAVLLKKHDRELVSELPAEVLAELDEKALEAWR